MVDQKVSLAIRLLALACEATDWNTMKSSLRSRASTTKTRPIRGFFATKGSRPAPRARRRCVGLCKRSWPRGQQRLTNPAWFLWMHGYRRTRCLAELGGYGNLELLSGRLQR